MKIIVSNPEDRDCSERYLLVFGAYFETHILAYGSSLEDALDSAVDWIADNAPGLLANDAVATAHHDALRDGHSVEDVQSMAEVDTTCAGSRGDYLHSHEWGVSLDNPSDSELAEYIMEQS